VLGVWGDDGVRIKSKSFVKNLIQWNKQAESNGKPVSVFPSLCDPFEDRPELVEWRREMFAVIDRCPWVNLLLLTKRPQNIGKMLYGSIPKLATARGQKPGTPEANIWHRHNVWLGTSCEDQENADKRIPQLLQYRDFSPVLFLSCEPLLGPVDLRNIQIAQSDCYAGPDAIADNMLDSLTGETCSGETGGVVSVNGPTIDWVIVGGESGPNARPMHPKWVRAIRDDCEEAGAPFLFKQWGQWVPFATTAFPSDEAKKEGGPCGGPVALSDFKVEDGVETCRVSYAGADPLWDAKRCEIRVMDEPWGKGNYQQTVVKVGKKKAGRLLDGKAHDGFPVAK